MSKQRLSLVEVGMRDGLQNEKVSLSPEVRIEFAKRMIQAGMVRIEAGSFVRADWVPQMAGSDIVFRELLRLQREKIIGKNIEFAALVPNERGMNDALSSGVKEIAIFAAASESFSQKNINCSIEESFKRFVPVIALAKKHKIKVRGYLSVCFGCPFEGKVPEARVIKLAKKMHDLGVYEISIGDTIGIATVGQVESLFKKLKKVVPAKKLAGHFHNTRGQALANILVSYKLGIKTFDTSLGGLGGCPYAPGASGNVATEDVVYMFQSLGELKKINVSELAQTKIWIREKLKN